VVGGCKTRFDGKAEAAAVLCDRDLHVVAGNALVIRGVSMSSVVPFSKVAGVHHDYGQAAIHPETLPRSAGGLFSRNSSIALTSSFASGRRPNIKGSFGYIWSITF